jgi:hypothetical protein
MSRLRDLSGWILFLMLCLMLAAGSGASAEQVSLRAHLGAEAPDWLTDFRFDLAYNRAQRQDVEVYSMDMKREHVRQLRARRLPWMSGTKSADADWVVGYSKGWWGENPLPPQPIFGYRITDPDAAGPKQRVVLAGGNHPREDPACWTLHGMVEFLVSDDPQAGELRQGFEFLVYPAINPDGKLYLSPDYRSMKEFRSINGNPEMSAAGESNHNRVWLSRGRFTSIDAVKTAMENDAGGGAPHYLLDFHGIPLSSYAFVDERAARSPLGRVLRGRGLNLRRSEEPGKITTLRSWAASKEGLNAGAAFTPELSHESMLKMLTRGRDVALAFHDVMSGKPPVHRQAAAADAPDLRPPEPRFAWLHGKGELPAAAQTRVKLVDDGPFKSPNAVSAELSEPGSRIQLDAGAAMDAFEDLTVSLWIKGEGQSTSPRYLISRYQPGGDQRSWALFQLADSRELQVTISADGSHERDRIKRCLTTAWPLLDVVSPEWRHVVFTYVGGNEGRLRLFLDGVETRVGLDAHYFDDSPVPRLHRNGLPLTIGALDGSKNAFAGRVSEVAVWDRALPPESALWLYRHSLSELR